MILTSPVSLNLFQWLGIWAVSYAHGILLEGSESMRAFMTEAEGTFTCPAAGSGDGQVGHLKSVGGGGLH